MRTAAKPYKNAKLLENTYQYRGRQRLLAGRSNKLELVAFPECQAFEASCSLGHNSCSWCVQGVTAQWKTDSFGRNGSSTVKRVLLKETHRVRADVRERCIRGEIV